MDFQTDTSHKPNLFERLQSVSFGKLSTKDQAFFAKRLSFLTRAGVPLLESLHMLSEQAATKRQSKMLVQIIADVSNGYSLSISLEKRRNLFGDFAINIIAVGEESGMLSENLGYLADELKKKQELKRKVIGALVYPAFITVATLGITLLLTVYIFPKIMPIFVSLNVHLPFSTVVLIYMSNFLRKWGVLAFLGLLALLSVFFVTLKESEHFHFLIDKLALKVPFIGTMVRNYNIANITRTLGLLLQSGSTLSDALPVTARATGSLVYKREFEKLASYVNRGEKLSAYLGESRKLFPDILTQVISVGERSGNLSETLAYLAQLYENEVEDATKNLSSLVEPVLMVCMGLIVGFVAISVITPIYGITQHLTPR